MAVLPEVDNFFSSLDTTLSPEQVAGLYHSLGCRIRKCSWTDWEIIGPWCDLVIEANSPILMSGAVADVMTRADEVIAPLIAARVAFTAECYGPDGELLRELRG